MDNMKKVLKKGAVRLNPNFPASYALLIYNYISLNRLDEAKATYEQALERKLKNPFSITRCIRLLFCKTMRRGWRSR